MTTIREMSRDGAYGYEYRVALLRSRRGKPYMEVSGFAWRGNTGSRHTTRYPLTDEGAAELNRLFDLTEQASARGGLLDGSDGAPVPWTLHDVPDQLRADAYAGPGREV